MSAQSSSGCGSCKYAGYYTEGVGSLMPKISREQQDQINESGATFYCTALGKPVWKEQGKTCSSFRDDMNR